MKPTNTNHALPLELVEKWVEKAPLYTPHDYDYEYYICNEALTHGSRIELDHCVQFIREFEGVDPEVQSNLAVELHKSRRLEMLSLKEEALSMLAVAEKSVDSCLNWDWSVVRRALEALPNE
jgi:hypothetical protein